MDIASLIGIIAGFATLVLGMIAKGADPTALMQPAALIIIFGGLAACLLIAFPMKDLKKLPQLFRVIFKDEKKLEEKELIPLFKEWAGISRKQGIMGLEKEIDKVDQPFLKKGFEMILEGQSSDYVKALLEEELASTEERHRVGAHIFTQAGTYAPTLGVLGAVMGLVSALGNLNDINALGHSISAAFIATLFGIFTGYVLAHPLANKLKEKSKEEIRIGEFIIEGILAIQEGRSPYVIEKQLITYLPLHARKAFEEVEEEG